MILTIPVLYRANIVKIGHRKPEDCLLSVPVPVRVQEVVPPLAVSLEDNLADYGERGMRLKPFMQTGPASWYEHDGQLLGEFQRRLDAGYLKSFEEGGMAGYIAGLTSSGKGWMVMGGYEAAPWISGVATAAGPESVSGMNTTPVLQIYDESMEVRSSQPAAAEARDIAIAHAHRTFRTMAVHAETGDLLVPSLGPAIMAASRPMSVVAYLHRAADMVHVRSALEFEDALEFSRDRWRGLPEIPPIQTLTVLRPDAVTWDAAATSIAACARNLGMGPSNADQWRTAWGMDSVNGATNSLMASRCRAALGSMVELGMGRFADVRTPDAMTVDLSIRAVEKALDTQRALSTDFLEFQHGQHLNPMAPRALGNALQRAAHLRPAPAAGLGLS